MHSPAALRCTAECSSPSRTAAHRRRCRCRLRTPLRRCGPACSERLSAWPFPPAAASRLMHFHSNAADFPTKKVYLLCARKKCARTHTQNKSLYTESNNIIYTSLFAHSWQVRLSRRTHGYTRECVPPRYKSLYDQLNIQNTHTCTLEN